MDDSSEWEDLKQEIRSILLPYQKGCYIVQFNHAYRELIGRTLPFRQYNFKSDIELLYAMPDVVKISPIGYGEYHLFGVADEKSKHIQKMVAKQKPTKLKGPPLSRFSIRTTRPRSRSRFSSMPPRFSQTRPTVEPRVYHNVVKDNTDLRVTINQSQQNDNTDLRVKINQSQQNDIKPTPSLSPMEEVILLVKQFNNRLAVDDVLCEYKRMYNKSLSLSMYGFSSIEECINEIPELTIERRNNVSFVRFCSEEEKNFSKQDSLSETNFQSYDESTPRIPTPEIAADSNSNDYHVTDNANIPLSLREKLQRVADRIPSSLLSSEFPPFFEDVTGQSLDLASLGYRCLGDLIDDVPSIFTRKSVIGSRKDFIIFPANTSKTKEESVTGSVFVQRIISNIRRILEAYPEGVRIEEVLYVYSINCKDTLHIKDLGFDDLETFLSSIKNLVPLRIGSINGEKSIHLVKLSNNFEDLTISSPKVLENEAIPYDAVFPEFVYKPQTFPPDFDFDSYIPAYTSSVAHAGNLHIQLQRDPADAPKYKKMNEELDNFYDGDQSQLYMMKNIHIKVGASCVAKWPADEHWYRAHILSIPSMDNIQVHYVDYGTKDVIPKFLLRYAKREFLDLPIQAIRCRLAFLKPPNNAQKWSIQCRDRILKLCEDVPLMAKIEEKGPDGTYSVILCDTNGEDDVYINDVLCKEGLAEYDVENADQSVAPSPEPPKPVPDYRFYLSPLQALQAQYYLQAFATVAPIFCQNEHYIKLFKEVSACCQSTDTLSQNLSVPHMPQSGSGPPGFSMPPSMMPYNTFPASPMSNSSIKKAKSIVHPSANTANFFVPNPEYESSAQNFPHDTSRDNTDDDNEIFDDDDDDEMFQQFCQKASSPIIHYVKRVMLGDGYKIHVINIKSKPYASSGDISHLVWNNKEADYLLRRLQVKEVDIPAISLSEDGNEELFQQLLRFNVKGVQKTTGFKDSIILYPLKTVIKILNIFGHPSVTLRTRLTEEITSFNPDDPRWKEDFPSEVAESDNEENFSAETDDDKIEKLCLYDLMAMKESIVCKRKRMLSSNLNRGNVELEKLEKLLEKVLQRIQEINEICKVFA